MSETTPGSEIVRRLDVLILGLPGVAQVYSVSVGSLDPPEVSVAIAVASAGQAPETARSVVSAVRAELGEAATVSLRIRRIVSESDLR